MSRVVALAALAAWVGATLLLSRLRFFARAPLHVRLRPYLPGTARPERQGVLSVGSFVEVIAPLSRSLGNRLARALGVHEDLSARLERVHSPVDATTFRLRQTGATGAGLGAAALVVLALRLPLVAGLLALLGTPCLVFLGFEQRLARASSRWQHRLFLELPVAEEQLAMLLSAGFSLGGALSRLSQRSQGAVGADLRRVCNRARQGVTEVQALREWAALEGVEALDRLVPVLALHSDTSDLGRLVSQEARATRQEAHRSLLATMERRAQQVWIPVSVATLVPGVIFLAVPFIDALRLFGGA
ncbi:MAG: type II secretion system F family protein [Acidimicrobiales bacterium]